MYTIANTTTQSLSEINYYEGIIIAIHVLLVILEMRQGKVLNYIM